MRTPCKDELSRRTLLQLGLSTAALLASPWPFRNLARAQSANPHFLVTLFCDGGWDPTQVLDPHDPLDQTDGIDVDVPQAISGLPPSVITAASGLTYVSNPTTRAAVDAYFSRWADQTAIVNGFTTRSTSHSQSTRLMLTGYLDPSRADFAVMSADSNGRDLPLPHLHLSGESFGGKFSGLSGRLGQQMRTAFEYRDLEDDTRVVSALGEAYVQQALEYDRLLSEQRGDVVTGRLADHADANDRADRLAALASSLNINSNDGTQLATSLGQAFRSGMTTSVTLRASGGFDTHGDNLGQNTRWNNVMTLLDSFLAQLATEPGVEAPNMLAETTVVLCSEFGRTPVLNEDNGKDHHAWNSLLVAGKGVAGATTAGMTDGNQEGVKTNLSTGQPDDMGVVLDVTHVVAGVLTLMGANSQEYLPNVDPLTAFVA